MFSGDALFKVYKLDKLTVDNLSIEKTGDAVLFNIKGKSIEESYELSFLSKLEIKTLYKFKINEEIDFNKYLLPGEVILKYKGKYKIIDNYKIILERYTEDNFLINIKFNNEKDLLGEVEISFSYIE